MSLFKERTANAKKVISLQNEIHSLKTKLQESQKQQVSCDHESLVSSLHNQVATLEKQVSDLKSDLKKVRSENTRLKKKVSSESTPLASDIKPEV